MTFRRLFASHNSNRSRIAQYMATKFTCRRGKGDLRKTSGGGGRGSPRPVVADRGPLDRTTHEQRQKFIFMVYINEGESFAVLKQLLAADNQGALRGTYKLPHSPEILFFRLSPLAVGFPQRRPLN